MPFFLKTNQVLSDDKATGGRRALMLIFLISILAIAVYVMALAIFEPNNFAGTGLGQSFGAASQSLNLNKEVISESDLLNFGSNITRVKSLIGLIDYAAEPISVGEKGRANPFEPTR